MMNLEIYIVMAELNSMLHNSVQDFFMILIDGKIITTIQRQFR